MGRQGKALRAVLGEITQSREHSSLFKWLVEHHDEIAAAANGQRLQWRALCAKFAEAQLTDVSGKSPTPATARQTWLRVRQKVAQARERQAAEAAKPERVGATPPSRIPRDWQPETIIARTTPANPAVSRQQRQEPSQGSRVPTPVLAAEAQALPPVSLNKPAPLPDWARHLGADEPEEENDDALLPPNLPPEFPAEARANLIRVAKEQRADDRKKFGLPPKRRTP